MKRMVTLLLCLLCLLLSGCGKKQQAADSVEPLSVKQVDSLLYHNDTTTLRFTNNGEKWIWADGETFPLDDSTIRQLLAQLPEVLSAAKKTNAADLSGCGLADPARYLTVGSGEDSRTLYFGTQAANGMWYMRMEEDENVYQVPDEFMQLLNGNIYDMAALPSLPELTEDRVTFIGVSQSEENNTYLLHADGAWKSNGRDVTDTAEKILAELADIKLIRCVDYFPAPGVSELCGLVEGATKITLKYMNSVGSESELTMTVGALMESEEGYYLTIGESEAIYCMPQNQLSTLLNLLS